MIVKKRNIFLVILLPALLAACANAGKSQVPVETKEKTEKEAVKEIEKQKEWQMSLPHCLTFFWKWIKMGREMRGITISIVLQGRS